MRTIMNLYLLLTRPVVALYDFRQFRLFSHKHVLYVAELAALVNTFLILFGIKVGYFGPYG